MVIENEPGEVDLRARGIDIARARFGSGGEQPSDPASHRRIGGQAPSPRARAGASETRSAGTNRARASRSQSVRGGYALSPLSADPAATDPLRWVVHGTISQGRGCRMPARFVLLFVVAHGRARRAPWSIAVHGGLVLAALSSVVRSTRRTSPRLLFAVFLPGLLFGDGIPRRRVAPAPNLVAIVAPVPGVVASIAAARCCSSRRPAPVADFGLANGAGVRSADLGLAIAVVGSSRVSALRVAWDCCSRASLLNDGTRSSSSRWRSDWSPAAASSRSGSRSMRVVGIGAMVGAATRRRPGDPVASTTR